MDQASPRTLLELLVRTSRRTIEENCAEFEKTAAAQGEKATLSPRQLWRWMAGEVGTARPVAQRVAELHWRYAFDTLIGPPSAAASDAARLLQPPPLAESSLRNALRPPVGTVVDRLELLRQDIHDGVSSGAMTEAGLDEWEQTVMRHGEATRFRPAAALLDELATDFTELQRVLMRRHTSSALRRLTRVTAQMAGLVFLTLIELNRPMAARNWARTARAAADEADDPTVRSWVRAQEAYVHYYAGNPVEALKVACHAQVVAGRATCVGVPLSAALEARALASLGRDSEARDALTRAEAAVGALDARTLAASAFGYNEAQLRFHEGNALTHLHDIKGAWAAQDRALELYPESDYLDRTLLELDRTSCLAFDGDATMAMTHGTEVVAALTGEQRSGMIVLRGRQILESLTPRQRATPSACEFRDLLMLTTEAEDDPDAVDHARR